MIDGDLSLITIAQDALSLLLEQNRKKGDSHFSTHQVLVSYDP
jgi:hypothetical protein